jgi:hypothetical protein
MKKFLLICLSIAMSFIEANAQCDYLESKNPSNVYYLFNINGQTYKFEGIHAYIACEHLLKAKETYYLNIDCADGKKVDVYKLKRKGEYAISVGGLCYYYRNRTTILCHLYQLDVKDILSVEDSHEGFVIGYDQSRRALLAIFKD